MENKPFVLFKTKNELLLASEQGQLLLEKDAQTELQKPEYHLKSLVGATVTRNSPAKVISVKLVDTPEVFVDLAF